MLTERERERVADLVQRRQIGPLPDGPMLQAFDPWALADALEQQAQRATLLYDVPKVDVRMDAADALALARCLRQMPQR